MIAGARVSDPNMVLTGHGLAPPEILDLGG